MAITIATDSNFPELVRDNSRTIVKFYADWCGSCRLFKPKFKRLSEDESFTGITFLDVNAQENPESRKLAGVTNLPFFAVFKDGQLLEGISTNKEEEVKKLIEKLSESN